MSLNIIVIAVILLIILAVMMFIFFRSSNTFQDGVNACDGTCVSSAGDCKQYGAPAIPLNCKVPGDTDSASGSFCCKALG